MAEADREHAPTRHAPVAERPWMPGYDVPDDAAGVLEWAWARERLLRSRNYWVTTVDAQARPHTMPVWGVWTDDDEFWFSCATGARKARNARTNPHVVIAADSSVEVVSVQGIARAATPAECEAAIAVYVAKYGVEVGDDAAAGLADFLRSNAAFVVAPTVAFGIIERPDEFSARATRWRWT